YLLPRIFPTQSMLLAEWVAIYPGPWDRYWNLSDGGFFESLGGYELVRRRVPRIVIADAMEDLWGQLEDFGEFVRKVRIDLGARVEPIDAAELDQLAADGLIAATQRERLGALDELRPSTGGDVDGPGPSRKHAALFRIRYETGPRRSSLLLYLKATLTGDEPA